MNSLVKDSFKNLGFLQSQCGLAPSGGRWSWSMTKAQLKPVSCCLLPLWKHITFWFQLGKAEGVQNPFRLGLEVGKSYKTQRMSVWQLCYNRSHRCSMSLHVYTWISDKKMMENSCWKFDYFLTGIFKEKGGILSKNKQTKNRSKVLSVATSLVFWTTSFSVSLPQESFPSHERWWEGSSMD